MWQMLVVSLKMMEQNIQLYEIIIHSEFFIFHFSFRIQMNLLDIIVSSWHIKHLISVCLSDCLNVSLRL